jgi:protein gp37
MSRELFPLPAAEVRPAQTLDAIAAQIRHIREMTRRTTLEGARDLGRLYLAAKERCVREGVPWLKWLESLGEPSRTVNQWMRISDHWHRISATVADMGLREALDFVSQDVEDDPHVTLEQWAAMSPDDRSEALSARGDKKFIAQGKSESIEWALWSWNPVTGCLHNCPYCYARDIATLGQTATAFPNGFAPTLIPSRLSAARNTPFPAAKVAAEKGKGTSEGEARALGLGNVFVCSMADLFGRWVPAEWVEAVLDVVRAAPEWTFLFLTKFPVRMAEFDFPGNAWVGTTVDCQARVKNAERSFRKIKAGVKWLSCEPLIEPLKFQDLGAFQWIVLGGASRSSGTPTWHPPQRWVLDLKQQAASLGIPYYLKANLSPDRERYYPGQKPEPEPAEAPPALRYLPTDGSLASAPEKEQPCPN